ncbi:protein PLANT CADMIUM RESISTANCE 7-like isoform X2 [Asparagus officinalis]|uniref:protein PLANT CADMIUM RESISTANCE 7-like isoform X2 n=1 Tax=Asparagus officinalis TaxID=4686 RepID=UPI00098E4608|nr:protein PLANT CADMIUM RESISTANCE 7-like isoform X2 [Asparagus officinalis]
MAELEQEEEEGNHRDQLDGGMTVLDFDMLCATVALQTHGVSRKAEGGFEGEFGGVQRMWEGEILDCLQDRRIAVQSVCCPCYRFGQNMRRANIGPCFLQGSIYFILVMAILSCFIAFGVTRQHCYLYIGFSFAFSLGLYVGYFRIRIKKQFNIGGSDSSLDECAYHLICPCCALSQENQLTKKDG